MAAVYLINTTKGLTQPDHRETQVEAQTEVGNKNETEERD